MRSKFRESAEFKVFLVIFIIIILAIHAKVTTNSEKPKNDTSTIKSLIARPLKGIIISIEPKTRGFYHVGFDDKITGLKLKYTLDGGYLLFKEHNVKVGDSVSKDTNSTVMSFYGYKGGIYQKKFDYELRSYLQNP